MDFIYTLADKAINARIHAEAGRSAAERGLMIASYNRTMRALAVSRPCSIPGCSELTTGCHTIQAAGPLAQIAENGKLMTPKFRLDHERHEFCPIGIWEATKTPMFCSQHDTVLFQDFERSGAGIQTPAHAELQIARSIVREYILLKLKQSFMPSLIREMTTTYGKRVSAIVTEEYRRLGLTRARVKVAFGDIHRDIWVNAEKTVYRHGQALAMLGDMLVPGLDILNGRRSNSLRTIVVDLPASVPYAFSCFASFGTRSGLLPPDPVMNPGHHHILVAAGLPQANSTKLIITVSGTRHAALMTLLDAKGLTLDPKSADELDRWTTFSEQLMISSGDHYFIRPSAYEVLNKQAKERLETMLNQRGALLDEWPSRIF